MARMPMSEEIKRAIEHFKGAIVDPYAYDRSVSGLDRYCKATGVRNFSGREVARPHQPDKAEQLGYPGGLIIPPFILWPWTAALVMCAEQVRTHIGDAPIVLRNAYRPDPYNSAVSSSGPKSDHPNGCGVDLAFDSSADKSTAADWLKRVQQDEPWLEMSLGIYTSGPVIHVGIMSPSGRRSWT